MRPLGFFSRRLNSSQLKWTIFSRELLAVYLATKHFSYFLEGSLFTIQTDHQALVSTAANAKSRESSREVRHLQYLTAMRPKWEFITGSNNNTADTISRATPPSPTPATDDSNCVRSLQDHQPTINTITSSLLHRQYKALRTHQAIDPELKLLVTQQHASQATEELVLVNNLFCVINGQHIHVPHPLRNTMLHDVHDTTHPGLHTTLREATRLYYWPHMKRDVLNWTKACLRCQAVKVTKHNTTSPTIMAPSSNKFHAIHLDIVGPLNELKGMRYILNAVDRFSRLTMAEPMPNQLASTVTDTFIRGWVQHHGIPHTIATDRGGQFRIIIIQQLTEETGLPAHPYYCISSTTQRDG